jgi:2-polyprenyl-6-methoxyphenol hydroxylase-like FAD-dependent oxidoreductase
VTDLTTACCIAGGGPAGMMLGYILARAGVDVIVLEKHADFLRDFRGDTVHPSTLEVMRELGLLDDFLQRPHQQVQRLAAQIGDDTIHAADFSRLPLAARFIALMPQWDFLNFLVDKAKAFPSFRLMMQAEAVDLTRDGERVTGVVVRTPDGEQRIAAALLVGADGRHSTIRERAGFVVEDIGAPMDVLWMRLPRKAGDDDVVPLGHAVAGGILVLIPRGDYFQCGFVVKKGGAEELQAKGLEAFKRRIEEIAPALRGRCDVLTSWDDVKLLTVAVDRLKTWCAPGVLCIGDAAHAMSPIGGVGINLAVQDAVAAANLLWSPLKAGSVSLADLAAVQRRRQWPTEVTQGAQVFIQRRAIAPTLAGASPRAPWPAKVVDRVPFLQGLTARVLGLGVRFEKVRAPAAAYGSDRL